MVPRQGCILPRYWTERDERPSIKTAGGEKLFVEVKGSVDFPTPSGSVRFENILYVPGVTKNLLSIGTITNNHEDYKMLFDSQKAWILRDFPSPKSHHIVTSGKRDHHNGLYKFRPPKNLINSITIKEENAKLWHSRLGHTSPT